MGTFLQLSNAERLRAGVSRTAGRGVQTCERLHSCREPEVPHLGTTKVRSQSSSSPPKNAAYREKSPVRACYCTNRGHQPDWTLASGGHHTGTC